MNKILGLARGAMKSGAGRMASVDMASSIPAAVGWIGKHNVGLGAGIGAAAGFIGSGGDIGGAVVGGLAGGMGASRRGWGKFNANAPTGSRMGRKMVGKLGRHYSAGAGGAITQGLGPAGRNKTFTSRRSGGSVTEFANMPGHARNVGGKMMAAASLAPWQMAGAGIGGGMAYGFGKSAIGGIGSSFGSENKSHYGTSFSGMGNAGIGGY